MTFLQIIDCKTNRFDEMNRLMDTWVEQTKGKRTATHSFIGKDRSDSSHYIEIVEFPSYEEAMLNSQMPETDRVFREIVALCDEMPVFTDLDVVRDEQTNKAIAKHFFEEVAARGDHDAFEELFSAEYHDHDIANAEDTMGLDGMWQEVQDYRSAFAFEFTVDGQLAEGDEVATRWSWRGTHHGPFMGRKATDKEVSITGITIFRFKNGKIAEGWWDWDNLSMLRQLGIVQL